MRRWFVSLSTTVIASAILVGCSSDTPTSESDQPTLRVGPWHANITVPGGDIRFGMEISRSAETLDVTLINGSERVHVPAASFDDRTLTLEFPAFNNRIVAQHNDGELSGTLTLVKRYGKTQVMPFVAKPGARPGPDNATAAGGDVSGSWAVTFTEEDGTQYPAIGEFSQRGSRLLGTFLTQTGDYRYLGGSMIGDRLELSTFDGAHAFLFTATLDKENGLNGFFWSGTQSEETWSGNRDPQASLADPTTLTALKAGYDRFTFEFPDLDGNLVSIDDDRFAGKVLAITLAGSWCPNCHDEAAYMSEIYPIYRERGVEVVALMFEHFEDRAEAVEQVRRFRDKFDIEYTTLLAGISDKTLANEALPSLDKVLAFPTTIFVDRNGQVREIHTGFSGPGTGKHYEETKRYITGMLDQLAAESPTVGNADSAD